MKTSTHFNARRLALTLLALLSASTALAQLAGTGTENDPFLIANADDWAKFTEDVNGGINTRAYYQLTSDIVLGTSEKPITTVVGTDEKHFRGYFDGNFHTIHINMVRDENYAAPFGVTNGAIIRNLKVDGTIRTDHKFAGGIVAYANNKYDKSTTLINCISSIHIICDDIITLDPVKPYDCTHGGLVGQNESGTLNFVNCVFDGWIKDFTPEKKANKCTGFVAWVNNTVNYTNCTMAGVIDVKPNDKDLKNSMANFHRLSASAHAYFHGKSYFITDYTYNGLDVQGIQAYTTAVEDTISRRYTFDDVDYFFPGVEVVDDELTFSGWKLTEGTDYVINKVSTSYENKLVFKGVKDYSGSFSKDVDPTCQVNVSKWDDSEKTGWYAISSPINGQRFENVNHLTPASRHNIYRYNETKRQWQEYRNPDNLFDEFENGRGYLYRLEDENTALGFNGTVNTKDVEVSLSYTEGTDNLTGFNLIGNPFDKAIYKGVAIPNDYLKANYCVMTTEGTWSLRTDSEAIPVGAAILVQATAAEKIKIANTSEKSREAAEFDNIWFTVKNSRFEDAACINFKEGEGLNKMAHYNENAPMLYVKYNGENFAAANVSDDVKAVNLAFKANTTGIYTLSFNVNGNFSYLHLIDRMSGEDIDMLIDDSYTFVSSNTDNIERFIVKFDCNTYNLTNSDDSFAYQCDNGIIVRGNGELQVFDVMGRMVSAQHVNGVETVNKPSQGIYIFKLVGNELKTQKIVVR